MRLVAILFCLLGSSAAFSPTGTISIARSTARPAAASVCMGAATKPMRVNLRNREYNKKYKSEMKTRIKTVLTAVAAGEYAAAFPALAKAQAIIDKNVCRGIIHKNTAARRKSLLTLKVKALEASSGAVAPVAAPAEE